MTTSCNMWDLGSLTRDQTHDLCIGSSRSSPLDHQGSPPNFQQTKIVPYLRGILMPAISNNYDNTFIIYVSVCEWIYFPCKMYRKGHPMERTAIVFKFQWLKTKVSGFIWYLNAKRTDILCVFCQWISNRGKSLETLRYNVFVFMFSWSITALQYCLKFLLYSKFDQLYVYICLLPLKPRSLPSPSHLSGSSQSTELCFPCVQPLRTGHLFHTW